MGKQICTKEIRKQKRTEAYLSHRARPTWPSPSSSLGVFLPGARSSSVASSPPRTPPRPSRPLPSPLLAPRTRSQPRTPLPCSGFSPILSGEAPRAATVT